MAPPPNLKSPESARIDALVTEVGNVSGRVEAVQTTLGDVKSGIDELRSAVAGMVRLEMRHEAAAMLAAETRKELDALHTEVNAMKEQMPGLLETRQDVRRIFWIVIAGVTAAVLGLVLIKT